MAGEHSDVIAELQRVIAEHHAKLVPGKPQYDLMQRRVALNMLPSRYAAMNWAYLLALVCRLRSGLSSQLWSQGFMSLMPLFMPSTAAVISRRFHC